MSRNNRNRTGFNNLPSSNSISVPGEEVDNSQLDENPDLDEIVESVNQTPPSEPEAHPEPTPVPVVPKAVVNPPREVTVVSDLEKKLEAYVTGMLKHKDPVEVAKVQYGLFNVLRGIMGKQDPEDFRKSWNTLLRYVLNNQNTVFNESQLFRGAEAWPTSPLEFSVFRRLGWLLLQTADPKTRKQNLAAISIEKSVEGLKPQERSNILNFYG